MTAIMEMPKSPADLASREPALEDSAAIGDGRSIALIDCDGRVAWWCVPNIDSDPLFDHLVDPAAGGYFTLAPLEAFGVERHYRPDSNVLVSEYRTASGRVRVTDSMNSSLAGRLPWCELARRIEGLEGRVAMRATIVFGTRADTISPWLQPNEHGCIFHARPVLGLFLRSPSLRPLQEEDRTMVAQVSIAAGEKALVAIVAGEDQPLGVPRIADLDQRLEQTDQAWKAWAQGLHYDGPYRKVVRRSALVLKLLLFSPTGAIAAAATTSLPERIGGDKNWDYRYAWVRDAAYTLAAFTRLDVIPESQPPYNGSCTASARTERASATGSMAASCHPKRPSTCRATAVHDPSGLATVQPNSDNMASMATSSSPREASSPLGTSSISKAPFCSPASPTNVPSVGA